MTEPLPLFFTEDEVMRLHDIAHVAALQTGAKGLSLDEVTSEIFRSMARQTNRSVINQLMRPQLKLVE